MTTAIAINAKERELLIHLSGYTDIIIEASQTINPAILVNYLYTLAKLFNNYYHEYPILQAQDEQQKQWRLLLATMIAERIKC